MAKIEVRAKVVYTIPTSRLPFTSENNYYYHSYIVYTKDKVYKGDAISGNRIELPFNKI